MLNLPDNAFSDGSGDDGWRKHRANPHPDLHIEITPPHLLGRFYAVYGLHWDISRSIGPLAGGLILTSFGGEVIFYALAVCLLAAGLSLTYTIEKLEHKVIRKVNRL